jgi:hypothetical protein
LLVSAHLSSIPALDWRELYPSSLPDFKGFSSHSPQISGKEDGLRIARRKLTFSLLDWIDHEKLLSRRSPRIKKLEAEKLIKKCVLN